MKTALVLSVFGALMVLLLFRFGGRVTELPRFHVIPTPAVPQVLSDTRPPRTQTPTRQDPQYTIALSGFGYRITGWTGKPGSGRIEYLCPTCGTYLGNGGSPKSSTLKVFKRCHSCKRSFDVRVDGYRRI